MSSAHAHKIGQLRRQIAALRAPLPTCAASLPFGVPEIDQRLPAFGLPLGVLHEFSGTENVNDEAAALLFIAGLLARMEGPIIWCFSKADLFAPSLPQAGLDPGRIVFVEGAGEKTVLMVMEEGLRHAGLTIVGELKSLSMTASRRLHLAARTSGTTCFCLRRRKSSANPEEINAAATRWKISCLPSSPLPVKGAGGGLGCGPGSGIGSGIGRARWLVELLRCRDGEPAQWIMEACDAKGYLALPSDLADRSRAQAAERLLSA